MKRKLKLTQCIVESCKKTFSSHDGDLDKKICFSCQERKQNEAEKQRKIMENLNNRKKKARKPRKVVGNKLEKLAEVV